MEGLYLRQLEGSVGLHSQVDDSFVDLPVDSGQEDGRELKENVVNGHEDPLGQHQETLVDYLPLEG